MDGSPHTVTPRYKAFLSYSHRDKATAVWLHRALESYRLPSKLVGSATGIGKVPARIRPIFRDREELSASHDLGSEISAALAASEFLIVICSPAAAASKWVNQEILNFKQMHGEHRVLALIAGGEPFSPPAKADEECFPASLRYQIAPDGRLSERPAEPVAADIRPEADGKRLAKLKLVAGLTGLRLDDLIQRETQRRLRNAGLVAGAASVGMLAAGALAAYANARRIEANEQREIAEREARAAKTASDFLIGTFVLTNPATENPREITALTVLERGAERAREELAEQPQIQARLIGTIGRAYNNLGLFSEARRLLETSSGAIGRAGPEGANAELALAMTYLQLGLLDKSAASVRKAEALLGSDADQFADIRASAEFTRGMIYTANGELTESLDAFARSLKLYRSMPRPDDRKIAAVLVSQGSVLSDSGQFEKAETALIEALEIHQRVLGQQHLSTGQTWFMLAQNAFLEGNLPIAEARINTALTIERQMLDDDNPIIADSLSMQGQILQGQGRLPQAEKSLEEAIAIYRKAFGGPHYLIGIAEIYLALVESERGRTAKALAILDDAKTNYDASYGGLHANHGDLLVNRATILARAGRRPEALADCAKGMKILGQTLGAEAAFTKQLGEVCAKL
ncbi:MULTISPECIES: tetratricopeptide repeat protein [Phenylobacterium]|uniref:Tetratricopeptide (TPR) repeat protein n=1 Tax=Phenylobacterium koreense TaxID=266125 RepID=A0ABV2ELE5_9CAUL